MTAIEDLVAELARPFGEETSRGIPLRTYRVKLDVPVETRLKRGGALLASLPRGLWSTGFMMPHGQLRFRLDLKEAER